MGRDRFNEAEAFTPRIRGGRKHRTPELICFNEAEAFTPRIPTLKKVIT